MAVRSPEGQGLSTWDLNAGSKSPRSSTLRSRAIPRGARPFSPMLAVATRCCAPKSRRSLPRITRRDRSATRRCSWPRSRSSPDHRLGLIESRNCSAPAGWARSTARAMERSNAMSPLRSCPNPSRPTRSGSPACCARRGYWPRSIIPISPPFTAWSRPTPTAASSSSSSRDQRWPSAGAAACHSPRR